MISHKKLDNILFLDIETVPQLASFDELSEEGKALWKLKSKSLSKFTGEDDPSIIYGEKAGIFAEFSKVICISVGYLKLGSQTVLRIKSFSGEEKLILSEFTDLLDKYFDNPKKDFICGHNIKEFDIPFLCRRMMAQGIEFPELLKLSGKKPWEVNYLLDTLQLWKFGDFKNYTSLRLLCYALGLPSPKDDIDGSQVASVYYEDQDLDRIVHYCEKDVATVCKVLLKMIHFPLHDLVIDRAE